MERQKAGGKERNQNVNSGKFSSQFPRIKAITEVEVTLRESSIPEKNCTESTPFPSAVVHGCISQETPPWFPAQVTTVNTLTWRWPCSSGVLDEGFCVWAMLTPVCYPTSGLEETVSSWEKALPVSAQEKHLSLHFPFMAEATSPLNPWLLAQMNVFVLLMFYKPSSRPCTCLFYWVGKHWDQGHLHSADTLCTIIDSQF